MSKCIDFILLAVIIPVFAQAQLSPDSVAARLWQQTCLFPNEKIYLHTDRSLYMGGDTLWFRAYLVNAINNQPEKTSRYIYTELVNPFSKVVKRVKIKQDVDGLFYGYLPLDMDLPGGEYTVRAYTRYMENSGESFFFRKPVRVVTPFEKALKTDLSWEVEATSKQVKGVWEMKNLATGMGIPLENVTVSDENGTLEYWTKDKQCNFKVTLGKYKRNVILLEASNYQQYFLLSLPRNDYEVDFLPEGGNLPAGVLSRMAFKALNTFGLSEDISGVVKDDAGNEVCRFQTEHAGMGSFNWMPEAGKKYHAECVSKSGVARSFDLPVAQPDAYSLNVVENRGKYLVSIRCGQGQIDTERLFTLLVHERGVPLLAREIRPSSSIRIDQEIFPTGVLHFVLVSPESKVVSERLAFVRNDDQAVADIRSQQKVYGRREKVQLSVTLRDKAGNPVAGNMSVAVTDNGDLSSDDGYTIYTSLLLTSDLRGYIENPGWYFQSEEPCRQAGLDLLMLTQGWRQYHLEEGLSGDYKSPKIKPELYQRLTGEVKRLVGNKGINEAQVLMHIPMEKVLEKTTTDKQGKFEFGYFEFPDSTQYHLQALTAKNGDKVLLSLHEETFPAVNEVWPLGMKSKIHNPQLGDQPVSVDFMDKSNRRMEYLDGMRNVFLEDVVVTAKKRELPKTCFEGIIGGMTLKRKDIEDTPIMDLRTFIQSRFPGIYFEGDAPCYRGSRMRIILNEFPIQDTVMESQILGILNLRDIEQIDFNRDRTAGLAWFPMTGAFFIAITLKKDLPVSEGLPKNIDFIRLLGYQKPAAFYSPKYETMQQQENPMPDLRTTLYWNPKVQTDEQGNASVEFYTADSEAPFSVVVEGITDDGRLIRGKW